MSSETAALEASAGPEKPNASSAAPAASRQVRHVAEGRSAWASGSNSLTNGAG